MKKIGSLLCLSFSLIFANAQTLQTVTDNGASTNHTLNSFNPNGFQVTGTLGSPAYFVIDQTANPGGKRWRLGHTGISPGFGGFDIYNITDEIAPLSIMPNGRLGIGTTTPNTLTEIRKTFPSGAQGIDFLRLTSSQSGAWFSQLGLQFRWEDTGNQVAFNLAQITALPNWPTGTTSGGDLQFWTKSPNTSNESELTEKMRIDAAGNVGIGVIDTKGYKLAVAGNMIAESVKVKLQGTWPDYVFSKSYALPTLQETEQHIKEKGHLPGIPNADEVKANGIDLEEMNAKLLQKIEELTMHLIEQNRTNLDQKEELKSQRSMLEKMQVELDILKRTKGVF